MRTLANKIEIKSFDRQKQFHLVFRIRNSLSNSLSVPFSINSFFPELISTINLLNGRERL